MSKTATAKQRAKAAAEAVRELLDGETAKGLPPCIANHIDEALRSTAAAFEITLFDDGLLKLPALVELFTKARNLEAVDVRDLDSTPRACPEAIEARRADYERLWQALSTITELESQRVPSLADVEPKVLEATTVTKQEKYPLVFGFRNHVSQVFDSVDWYDARAGQVYVELRLLSDMQAEERAKG